jgi:hypothetical protein
MHLQGTTSAYLLYRGILGAYTDYNSGGRQFATCWATRLVIALRSRAVPAAFSGRSH